MTQGDYQLVDLDLGINHVVDTRRRSIIGREIVCWSERAFLNFFFNFKNCIKYLTFVWKEANYF